MLINSHKRTFLLMALMLFIVSTFPQLAQADQLDAATAIASAKEQILICYQAVKEAEGAGANITALVAVLNDAGTLLSRAEFAYSVSDFDIARDLAVQSQSSLDNFVSDANVLRETGTQQRSQDFLINVVGSLVGAFAVVGAGIAIWSFLRRKYKTVGEHKDESSRL
jgi:hypothetical protein